MSSQFSWNKCYKYLCCENCLRPLETAETNARRLAGDQTITLPFATECCPTTKRLGEIATCPHCHVQYCSEDCRVEAAQKYHFTLCLKDQAKNVDHPFNSLIDSWKWVKLHCWWSTFTCTWRSLIFLFFLLNRKIHYPPETTTIELIAKLLGMCIQANDKAQFVNYLKDFQSKVVNEDLMIAHKMLGPNFESQLSELYPLYCKAFGTHSELAEVCSSFGFLFCPRYGFCRGRDHPTGQGMSYTL